MNAVAWLFDAFLRTLPEDNRNVSSDAHEVALSNLIERGNSARVRRQREALQNFLVIRDSGSGAYARAYADRVCEVFGAHEDVAVVREECLRVAVRERDCWDEISRLGTTHARRTADYWQNVVKEMEVLL